MKLSNYIKEYYRGNMAAYARSISINPTQVKRWLDMECIVIDDEVWRKVRPIKKESS